MRETSEPLNGCNLSYDSKGIGVSTGKYGSQSLIPYLDRNHARYHLGISLRSEDPSVFERGNPFLVISESGPLARIIEGRFVTNAGSELKRAFLLVQKDEYHFAKDELWPVCNRDIDQCWQKAFLRHSDKGQDDSMIVLSDQVGSEGNLESFLPLFFCKSRQIFFHPLCPKCGASIHQCYDDELLKGFGLKPYSTSLRRYVFCPSCLVSEGKTDFYVVSLESSDPPTLKDHQDLIKGFGNITEDRNPLRRFPCGGCATHPECYGPDCLAISRIMPFSFYPFFMLIFDAMSVNAVDFLALISGAPFEELEMHLAAKQEPGRISCLNQLKGKGPKKTPFFFDRDERSFLEVLYLKISFLGELVQTVFPEPLNIKYPDLGISIDRVWVKLADQAGLLPLFWDFKVRLMDVAGDTAKIPLFPKMPLSHGLYYLGLLWFYTLLTNKKQEISEVYGVIRQAMEKAGPRDSDPNSMLINWGNPVFAPENIFWDPDFIKERPIDNARKGLFEESLGLGWSLLRAGLMGGPEWSKEIFLQDMENIRVKVKDRLFLQGAVVRQTEPVQENKAIQDILTRIMEKCCAGPEPKPDDLDKTVVLPASSDHVSAPSDEALSYEEDLQQTVILSPDLFVKEPMAAVREEDELDKTVIMATGSSDKVEKTFDEHDKDDSLAETVILRPGGAGKKV